MQPTQMSDSARRSALIRNEILGEVLAKKCREDYRRHAQLMSELPALNLGQKATRKARALADAWNAATPKDRLQLLLALNPSFEVLPPWMKSVSREP
jgi:hypothetical protein